jgi:hypothetical protein
MEQVFSYQVDEIPAASGSASALSYDSCVARTLVHKEAVSEVLLTDAHRIGDNRFTVAAQWPRDHVLFSPGGEGTSDPLLWIETIRQTAIYLSHRFYGVPLGHPFILVSVDFTIDNPLPPGVGSGPLSITLDATCEEVKREANHLVMAVEASVLVNGRRAGRLGMQWQAVTPRMYALIRNRRTPTTPGADAPSVHATVPVPPEAIGRRHDRDVLLSGAIGTDRAWNLRLDTEHPVLFDHGSDHIPGVALIEACRQAAALALASDSPTGPGPCMWVLRSGAFSFESFGDLTLPVVIVARPGEVAADGTRDIRVAALQGQHALSAAVLRGSVMPLRSGAAQADGARC